MTTQEIADTMSDEQKERLREIWNGELKEDNTPDVRIIFPDVYELQPLTIESIPSEGHIMSLRNSKFNPAKGYDYGQNYWKVDKVIWLMYTPSNKIEELLHYGRKAHVEVYVKPVNAFVFWRKNDR